MWRIVLIVAICAGAALGQSAAPAKKHPPIADAGQNDSADPSTTTQPSEIAEGRRKVVGFKFADLELSLPILKENGAVLPFKGPGAIVVDVAEGTPAEKSGFMRGDVLRRFEGAQIKSAEDLARMIQEVPIGAKIKFDLLRFRKTRPDANGTWEYQTTYTTTVWRKIEAKISPKIPEEPPQKSKELAQAEAEIEKLRRQVESINAADDEKNAEKIGTLTGAAWITRKGGTSDPLRGLKIYLVRADVPSSYAIEAAKSRIINDKSVKDMFFKLVKEYRLKRGEKFYDDLAKNYEDDIADLDKGIEKATAEVERFEKLPPGSKVDLLVIRKVSVQAAWETEKSPYVDAVINNSVKTASTDIDGKYKVNLNGGRYYVVAQFTSSIHAIEWCLPLKVDGSEVKIDLYNENAERIFNKR